MYFLEALLQYSFLQRALVTAVMVGIFCGVIGSFIILRGMALMGDAISHAVLPGVAISYMLGANLFYGAVITGLLTALGIGYVNQNSRLKSDTAIGIVFSAAFALGIIMISLAQASVNLNNVLFGNLLAVTPTDLRTTLLVGLLVLAVTILFYKELKVSSFDPTLAQLYGLPNRWVHYMLMGLLTLVTVAALQTVGIVLVVAMLVTPAASAYLLTQRLKTMLLLAALLGMVSALIGLYFSFAYNLPSGAAIVAVASVLFAASFIFSRQRGKGWPIGRRQPA